MFRVYDTTNGFLTHVRSVIRLNKLHIIHRYIILNVPEPNDWLSACTPNIYMDFSSEREKNIVSNKMTKGGT